MPSESKTDTDAGNDNKPVVAAAEQQQQVGNVGGGQQPKKVVSEIDDNTTKNVEDYLPPLPLVMTILGCSGFMFLYAFRDVFATGKVIGGTYDDALLVS
jgi:hypothetical protein